MEFIDEIISHVSNKIGDNKTIEEIEVIKSLKTKTQDFGQQIREASEKQIDLKDLIKNLELSENELHCNVRNNIDELNYIKEKISTLSSRNISISEVRKQEFDDLIANIKEKTDVFTKAQEFTAEHFGFKIKITEIDCTIFEVQFMFSENQFVILDYNFDDRGFNLKLMRPVHPNLDKIKMFLAETSDISGFLYYTRQYFESIEKRSERSVCC